MSRRPPFDPEDERSQPEMNAADAAKVEQFRDFLRRVDPPGKEGNRRLAAWIAADPAPRRAYLGLPPAAPDGVADAPDGDPADDYSPAAFRGEPL